MTHLEATSAARLTLGDGSELVLKTIRAGEPTTQGEPTTAARGAAVTLPDRIEAPVDTTVCFLVLDTFSGYDHPASKIGTMLALPWLVAHRNADGSWGEQDYTEVATLAVTRALRASGCVR